MWPGCCLGAIQSLFSRTGPADNGSEEPAGLLEMELQRIQEQYNYIVEAETTFSANNLS